MKLSELIKNFRPGNSIIKPYIVAEAGVNHEGSMEIAKRMVADAAEGGAQGIKFQSYKAETIASRNSPSYWDLTKEPTTSQFELFKKHDKFWKNEFEQLKKECDKVGIEFFSTPFDIDSATFLNDLMDIYKISSSDITNKPFIEFICDFNKPIALSTGASYPYEIMEAVEWINNKGNPLSLLHCVLNYPTENKNVNLGMILDLRQKFPNHLIGYSDHTLPNSTKVIEAAALLGAGIIEKHFTHDKSLPGNDHYHAMDKEDLKQIIKSLDEIFVLIGSFDKTCLPSENISRQNARRSLVANRFIKKGNIVQTSDLTWKRPAFGVSPREIEYIVGRKALLDIPIDTVIKHNMVD